MNQESARRRNPTLIVPQRRANAVGYLARTSAGSRGISFQPDRTGLEIYPTTPRTEKRATLPDEARFPLSVQGEQMVQVPRTASEWFQEATRTYIEKHQGCPWCGGSHRVFVRKHDRQVIYECHRCDFRAGHDAAVDRYFFTPGEDPRTAAQDTMYEI
jgi:hypothetical protein